MRDRAVAEILGAHLAESEPSGALWHRVAQGELSADEAEALLLAERDVGEDERAGFARAKLVFAPPTSERRQQVLEALLVRRATDGEGVVVPVPMRPHRTRRWAAGLVTAAAAVVLTLWLVPPRRADGEAFTGKYTMDLEKAAVTVRGAEIQPEVATFLLGGKIGIRLVPEAIVEGPVGVAAYVWERSGQPRRLELEPTVHPNGVVEFDTTVSALGLGEGEWELVIAIGWTEVLPSSWEEVVEAEGRDATGFEVVRTRVRVASRP